MMHGLKRAGQLAVAVLAVTAFAGGARVASAASLDDLVGQWNVMLLIPDSPQMADLKVEKNGDKLHAHLKSALGDNDIDDIALEGEEFVLTYMLKLGDQNMDVQVTSKVEGDGIKGTVLVSGGAMKLELKGAKTGTEADKALKAEYDKAIAAVAAATPTLSVMDAKGFMGAWVLTLNSPQGARNVDFEMKDTQGKAQGELKMPPPIGTRTINKISKNAEGGGLKYEYDFKLGEQNVEITMILQKEGEDLKGRLSDKSGMMSMDLTGMTKKKADAQGISTANHNEAGAQGQRRGGGGGGGGFGAPRETATLKLADKNVTITYGSPSTSGPGYKAMQATLKDGYVWRMGKDQATKLKTDVDLKFGDKVIKAGSYSLWAKRVGDAWHLLVNTKADVWGTMYDASADIAEIPMQSKKLDKEVADMKLTLKEANGGGVLTLDWGKDEGSVSFTSAK